VIHALTGCDKTSTLCSHGKASTVTFDAALAVVYLSVIGKILFKSIWITSTSIQPTKYLKYKCKYIILKVSKIQVQNTAPQKVFKIKLPKYLLGGG